MKYALCLFFLLLHQSTIAQRIASGQVVDYGDNTPLIGANIVVTGYEQLGTITDLEGKFQMEVPDEATTLLISFTGYQSEELPIEACQNTSIGLSVSATLLNEVLITGYGTQVRSDLTANISKIGSDDIENIPVNTLESVIQGRTAGVFVTNESGKLGFNADIRPQMLVGI